MGTVISFSSTARGLSLAHVAESVRVLETGDEQQVPALVDEILDGAASCGASDVHIESTRAGCRVRFRIDGQLLDVVELSKRRADNIIARLKLMSKAVTYRKRSPQDGRVGDFSVGALRAAFMPTLHGEKVVVRLPVKDAPRELADLGMDDAAEERLRSALLKSHGVIIFTGPCSSGKSTSIYAALRYLLNHSSFAQNVVTLEDPIEQEIEGVSQTQADPVAGLSFAAGLRTLLRMDPNVIVVGEVRDHETVETVINAGLSGHLVLTTMHGGTSAQVFTRLLHMGIEPFLVASAINAVVAQRLVRRLCDCRVARDLTGPERDQFGARYNGVYDAVGCELCNFTGYKGRLGAFEVTVPDAAVKTAILQRVQLSELEANCRSTGMTPLNAAVEKLVAAGDTTIEEWARSRS